MKKDWRYRSCKLGCRARVWCVTPRNCDECRRLLRLAAGGGGSDHGGEAARQVRESRIERYAALVASGQPVGLLRGK